MPLTGEAEGGSSCMVVTALYWYYLDLVMMSLSMSLFVHVFLEFFLPSAVK